MRAWSRFVKSFPLRGVCFATSLFVCGDFVPLCPSQRLGTRKIKKDSHEDTKITKSVRPCKDLPFKDADTPWRGIFRSRCLEAENLFVIFVSSCEIFLRHQGGALHDTPAPAKKRPGALHHKAPGHITPHVPFRSLTRSLRETVETVCTARTTPQGRVSLKAPRMASVVQLHRSGIAAWFSNTAG